MDFYKEILESFSRKHGRKLKLLEQEGLDPEAEALAQQAKTNAVGVSFGKIKDNPLTTPSGKPLWVWQSGKGGINFNNKPDSWGGAKGADDNWSAFVAAFTVDGGQEASAEEEVQPVIELSQVEKTLMEAGIEQPEIYEELKSEYDKMLQDVKELDLGGRPERSLYSFHKALLKDTPNLLPDEDGLWRVEDTRQDAEVSLDIAVAINNLEKGEGCDKFKVTDKGSVAVFLDNDTARVFNGDGPINVVNAYMKKAGCTPETINIVKNAAGVGGANNVRGNVIEPVADLWAIARHLQSGNLTPEQANACKAKQKEIIVGLNKGIRSLKESTETWMAQAKEAAVSEDDQSAYEQLQSLFADGGKNMIALYHVAAMSNKIRRPDISLRVGEQVGFGNKQDSFEMWKDRKAGNDALKRSGAKGAKMIGLPASKIFEGREDDLKSYISMGMIDSPNEPLFISDVSYKTLIGDYSASLGMSTDNNTDSFMKKGYPLASQFFNKAGLNKDAKLRSEVDQIHSEQMDIRRSVEELSTNFMTRIGDKNVRMDGVENSLNAAIDSMRSNQDYATFSKGDGKSLVDMGAKYGKMKDGPRKEKKAQEIKDKLKKIMLMNHLGSKEETKAGKTYAVGLAYMAGASVRDNTLFQVNRLDEMRSYISRQNSEFDSILESINNDDGVWNLKVGKGFSFSHSDDYRRSINTIIDKAGWKTGRSATSIKTQSKSFDILENTPAPKVESTLDSMMDTLLEVFGVLKEKMKVR
jgi:hypothetical protein